MNIKNNKQNSLYILNSIFFSLVLISFFVHPNFDLTNFDNRFFSYATSQGFDISKRISFYFKILGFFVFSVINFFIFLNFAKKFVSKNHLYFYSIFSLFGLLAIAIYFLGITHNLENIKFIIFLQINLTIYVLISNISPKKRLFFDSNFGVFFPFISILSIIIYLGFYFIFYQTLLKFPIFLSINLIFLILNFLLLFFTRKARIIYNTVFSFIPFLFIPVLYFLSTELTFALEKPNFNLYYSIGVATTLLITILLFVFIKVREIKLNINSTKKFIYNFYFPIFLIGILIFEYYSPYILQNTEMFEKANPALAIQQFYNFGKIPFLQTFGSHALSEIFFGFIYTIFNGFNGLTYEIYDFFQIVIFNLLAFFIIRRLIASNIYAILFVITVPFLNIFIPQYFYFALIPLFVIYNLINKQTIFNYFLFFAMFALSILWRIDIGVAAIVALSLTFSIYFISKNKKIKLKKLLIGFGIFAVLLIPFFIIFYAKDFNILVIAKDILSYLSSEQTYGIPSLTYNTKDYIFYFHFIIAPAIVFISLIYAIYRLRTSKNKYTQINIAIIFLSVFYIINFQRGIVRHSFVEGWDTALSSFLFFILALTAIDFISTQSKLKKQIIFTTVSLVIILGFHYPQNSLSDKSNLNITKSNILKFTHNNNNFLRIKKDTLFYNNNINELKNFVSKYLTKNQTFIDFSNNPMLYFYLHKNNPNYFNQLLLSNHSEYLQKRFIEQLKNFDVPIVIYSNYPKNWKDKSDGIPNQLRYYIISEYLNKNYKPFAIISNKCIWIKNNFDKVKNNSTEILRNDSSLKYSATKNIEFRDDTLFKKPISSCEQNGEITLYNSTVDINKNKKYLFTLKGNIYPYDDMILQYTTATGIKKQKVETKNTYFSYIILDTKNTKYIKNIKLILNKNQRFNFEYFTITENDYIPDFYSNIFYNAADIGLIPYYLGNFDNQFIENNYTINDTIFSDDYTILASETKIFNFTTNTANSNYILLSAKANTDTKAKIIYSTNYTNRGGYKFLIKQSFDFKNYVFRFSVDKNWNNQIKKLKIIASDNDIEINKILLLKD